MDDALVVVCSNPACPEAGFCAGACTRNFLEDMKSDEALAKLLGGLTAKFGEPPTEDEVMRFILGNEQERNDIWNSRRSV